MGISYMECFAYIFEKPVGSHAPYAKHITIDFDDTFDKIPQSTISIIDSVDPLKDSKISLNSYQLRSMAGYLNIIADMMDKYTNVPIPGTLQEVTKILSEEADAVKPRMFKREIWSDLGDSRYVTMDCDGLTPIITGPQSLSMPLSELDNESRYADDWREVFDE